MKSDQVLMETLVILAVTPGKFCNSKPVDENCFDPSVEGAHDPRWCLVGGAYGLKVCIVEVGSKDPHNPDYVPATYALVRNMPQSSGETQIIKDNAGVSYSSGTDAKSELVVRRAYSLGYDVTFTTVHWRTMARQRWPQEDSKVLNTYQSLSHWRYPELGEQPSHGSSSTIYVNQ